MTLNETYTHTFRVTGAVYEGFISISNDRNPLHTDGSFARSKGFKDKVMHGNILNGFVSYFIGECLPVKNVILHSQNISYSLPVYMDEEVSFHAEITEFHEAVNVYKFRFYFKNAEGKKVAKGNIQIGLLT